MNNLISVLYTNYGMINFWCNLQLPSGVVIFYLLGQDIQ